MAQCIKWLLHNREVWSLDLQNIHESQVDVVTLLVTPEPSRKKGINLGQASSVNYSQISELQIQQETWPQ